MTAPHRRQATAALRGGAAAGRRRLGGVDSVTELAMYLQQIALNDGVCADEVRPANLFDCAPSKTLHLQNLAPATRKCQRRATLDPALACLRQPSTL